MPTKLAPELAPIASQIKQLIAAHRSSSLEIANLILASKRHFHTALAWLDWAHDEFGFARRTTFLFSRVAEFFAKRPDLVQQCALLDLTKIEMLDGLKDKLDLFLATHDLEELSRDELRDAVNAFLGRDAKPSPAKAPAAHRPEQLELALADAKQVAGMDPIEELSFANAYFKRWEASATVKQDRDLILAVADTFTAKAAELRKLAEGLAHDA